MARSEPRKGGVEERVREDLADLGDLDGVEPTLAALAYRLARDIDTAAGEDRRLIPALSRELRAVLAQLGDGRKGSGEDDDLDDLADPS